jgi:hypothetical protein
VVPSPVQAHFAYNDASDQRHCELNKGSRIANMASTQARSAYSECPIIKTLKRCRHAWADQILFVPAGYPLWVAIS